MSPKRRNTLILPDLQQTTEMAPYDDLRPNTIPTFNSTSANNTSKPKELRHTKKERIITKNANCNTKFDHSVRLSDNLYFLLREEQTRIAREERVSLSLSAVILRYVILALKKTNKEQYEHYAQLFI